MTFSYTASWPTLAKKNLQYMRPPMTMPVRHYITASSFGEHSSYPEPSPSPVDQMPNLAQLPTEILDLICNYLDPKSLCSIAKACRSLNGSATSSLYSSVVLDTKDVVRRRYVGVADSGTGTMNLRLLLRTLMENPVGASKVQEIKLVDFEYDHNINEDPLPEVIKRLCRPCSRWNKVFRRAQKPYKEEMNNLHRTAGTITLRKHGVPFNDYIPTSGDGLKAEILLHLPHLRTLVLDLPEHRNRIVMLFYDIMSGGRVSQAFQRLQNLELRTPTHMGDGSVVLSGEYSRLPSLQVLTLQGSIPKLIQMVIVDQPTRTTANLRGWQCDKSALNHHTDLRCLFWPAFRNCEPHLEELEWAEVEPCHVILQYISDTLRHHKSTLRSLSLARRRPTYDHKRENDRFSIHLGSFQDFGRLTYLDLNCRFFFPEKPGCSHMLPPTIEEVSIDAVTNSEKDNLFAWLRLVLNGRGCGDLPELKAIRCSFLPIKRFPFLGSDVLDMEQSICDFEKLFSFVGVKLEHWSYDVADRGD